jgi:hypothetical protein
MEKQIATAKQESATDVAVYERCYALQPRQLPNRD